MSKITKLTQQILVFVFCGFSFCYSNDINSTGIGGEIIRVIKPGVFDYKTNGLLLRMRAWGVAFPSREQPGYNQAISFTETYLIGALNEIKIRQEFDLENLKVVDVSLPSKSTTFSRLAIEEGIGWHMEQETNRHGFWLWHNSVPKEKTWVFGQQVLTMNLNPPVKFSVQNLQHFQGLSLEMASFRLFDIGLPVSGKYTDLDVHSTKEDGVN